MRLPGFGAFLTALALAAPALATCLGWDKSLPDHDPRYYSVAHEFGRSTFVVEVRSLSETWLGGNGKPKALEPPFQDGALRPWGFDPYAGALYEAEVLRIYKGKPPRRLTLFSENSTARFHLAVGQKYLLFVFPVETEHNGRQLTVDTCGNSGDLDRSRKALAEVRKLATRS